jgi:hypothetical protein
VKFCSAGRKFRTHRRGELPRQAVVRAIAR